MSSTQMSNLKSLPSFALIPICDEGFQKCWISPFTLTQINGGVACYLRISTSHSDFICQAWPSDRIQTNSISYSDVVAKRHSKFTSTIVNCMETTISKEISVTIVVENYKNIKHMKIDLHRHPGKIEKMCKNLLQKFCVAKDYIISLNKNNLAKLCGICYILINSCDSNDYDGFVVDQQTKFSVTNIISKERHLQKSCQNKTVIGGLEREAQELIEILKIPFHCKYLLSGELRNCLPKGILLRGPAGTGKTSLVKYVGYECNAYVITINGPEVFGARPGESEENLTTILDKALIFTEEGPTILFFDEIDTLCPDNRHSDAEKGVNLSRLLMDFFDRIVGNDNIMVIGATNRPASVDIGLRRPGRFDKEVISNY